MHFVSLFLLNLIGSLTFLLGLIMPTTLGGPEVREAVGCIIAGLLIVFWVHSIKPTGGNHHV